MDAKAQFISTLRSNARPLGLVIQPEQLDQMWHHFELLIDANQKVNLTRITDPAEAAVRHYADSLTVAAWVDQMHLDPHNVLDVGTGGGFPAIPLAIYHPNWHLTAIDGTAKKIRHVQEFVAQLGLGNCKAFQQRAEHWRVGVPRFDMILLKAIAPLSDCLHLGRRLCCDQTIVVCFKSDPLDEAERSAAGQVASKLGFCPMGAWPYRLTGCDRTLSRQLICFRYGCE